MKEFFQKLWTNPWFRGAIRAAEGGAVMAFITATASGFDMSKHGIRTLVAAMAGSAVMSVRNWLLQPPAPPAPPAEPPAPPQK